MTRITVVFHSGYGHTQRMARAVAEGANAQMLAIDADGNLPAGGWEQLKASDAIIFGSPTYMGNASWQFKKFADASSKQWYAQDWKDKLAAGFTNSAGMNGDKEQTIHALFSLAMQHGMIWVSHAVMPSQMKASKRDDPNYLAGYAGAMSQSPGDGGAGDMSPGDLETARRLGERVAAIAARLKA
jgi:NAD(P)H dehydrogenase (quinone)